MILTEKYHICLECDSEFSNELNLAICPQCLEEEKKNYKMGIPSKYETVNNYFRSL